MRDGRWMTLVMVLVFALPGCAAMQPGQGVDQSFASRWGCNYDEVMSRADALAGRLGDGMMYTPQVGWDACELMARNGKPDDVDTQRSSGRLSASWWYELRGDDGYLDMTLIQLDFTSDGWVVRYVGT